MKAVGILTGLILPATAFASTAATTEESGLFVWIFLGFFALVIVGQLVPAATLLVGIIKGVVAKKVVKENAS